MKKQRKTSQWDEFLLVETIAKEVGSLSAEVAREIIGWVKTHGFHLEWGLGNVICNGFLILDEKPNFPRALAVVSNGYFYVALDFLRRVRPFAEEEWLDEVRRQFKEFPRASPTYIDTLKIPLTTFKDRHVLDQLLATLEWITEAVQNA